MFFYHSLYSLVFNPVLSHQYDIHVPSAVHERGSHPHQEEPHCCDQCGNDCRTTTDLNKPHGIDTSVKVSKMPLLTLNMEEATVTFLIDTGSTHSFVRPQDIGCSDVSCKSCVGTAAYGDVIDMNGMHHEHEFTVSTAWPLPVLGLDLLSKLNVKLLLQMKSQCLEILTSSKNKSLQLSHMSA